MRSTRAPEPGRQQTLLTASALVGTVALAVATGLVVLGPQESAAGSSGAVDGRGPGGGASSTTPTTTSAPQDPAAPAATSSTSDVPGLAAGVVPRARSAEELAAAAAPLPVGDLPQWRQVFTEDFTTPMAPGGWEGSVYSRRWSSYDGAPDTHGAGFYDQSVLSVSDGHLDAALRTIDGTPRVTGLVPLVDGRWGGQDYGRYSVRFRADAAPGYVPALLLWPDSDVWDDGEVDFVEGAADGYLNSYNHCPGHAADACGTARTQLVWPDWHVATVEWTPTSVTSWIDGVEVLTSTEVPRGRMHLVMQQMARAGAPATSSTHVQVDWVAVWEFDPATGGGA